MLSFLGLLGRKKEEVLPPPPAVAVSSEKLSGEQLLYKMKYVGDDEKEYRQRNLILFRISIKRIAKEIQIFKEERRRHQRARKPLFESSPTGDIRSLAIDQRCRFLAYGYIRQKTYEEVEGTVITDEEGNKYRRKNARCRLTEPDRPKPEWDRVADLIFRYGDFNEFLLSHSELQEAKKEQLDLLRKWAGN